MLTRNTRIADLEAGNTLSKYHEALRAAELRDRLEAQGGGRAETRFDIALLWKAGGVWAVVVLLVAGVAGWFLDRVVAVEIVAVVTAIAIVIGVARPPRRTGGDQTV